MERIPEHAPCGYLSFGDDGLIAQANAYLAALLGYAPDELAGQAVETLLSTAGRVFYQSYVIPLLAVEGRAEEIYLSLRTRAGADLPVLLNAARAAGEAGARNHCVLVPIRRRSRFEDELIRARKTAEAALHERDEANRALLEAHAELAARQAELEALNVRLEALATSDGLTGLRNRRSFQDRLAAEVAVAARYGAPLSLLLADIDFFKRINDTYSHVTGDAVLRQVALLLLHGARSADFVARFGGEEFALLLPRTDAAGAVELAERLRAAVAAARPEGIPVTLSIGAATLGPAHAAEFDLVLAADKALYRSKGRGRNAVTHADDLPAAP